MSAATLNPIMIAAGGTGGHMFPGVALARVLDARGHRVAFVSDPRGAAINRSELGLPDDVERYTVSARHLGGGVLGAAQGLVKLIKGFGEAKQLIRRIKPVLAIGFGGYPSVPPILAAGMAGIPTIIHEQNAVLGRANRRLARGAHAFALSFADTVGLKAAGDARATLVGNPVRNEIAALADQPYPAPGERINLLILGGSLGAQVFAQIVPAAFASLPPEARQRFHVVQQCRPENMDAVRSAYDKLDMKVELSRFFPDVPQRLADTHLAICRAGASTVAELTAAGRPALYVPYPHAADDHQMANARAIESGGGGWVMAQNEFTPGALAGWLEAALDQPAELATVAAAARKAGHPQAARRLADLVEGLLPATGNGSGGKGPGGGPAIREAAE